MANIIRNKIGSALSKTTANAIASAAYATNADCLTIDNSSAGALLADFELQATFGAAPVAGSIQLVAVDYSLDGTVAGPAPTTAMQGRVVGTFSPVPSTGNAATAWRMSLNSVPLSNKTDYYLYNAATGQSLSAGSILRAQCWSPG